MPIQLSEGTKKILAVAGLLLGGLIFVEVIRIAPEVDPDTGEALALGTWDKVAGVTAFVLAGLGITIPTKTVKK